MIPEITVQDLASWRAQGKKFVLLDVREPDEVATARVDYSVWIPMRDIAQRLGELDPTVPTAVMCHHGGRSERVAGFLAARGFSQVVNVAGGIDAYAEHIEPDLARY
ncbi:MAG TPA: rhodanese-like domain-containing protein [Alphaproteobacteria bacterium]|nr:rhodanese-like domain-containing protein [Alphaproteobacteria bacterium]